MARRARCQISLITVTHWQARTVTATPPCDDHDGGRRWRGVRFNYGSSGSAELPPAPWQSAAAVTVLERSGSLTRRAPAAAIMERRSPVTSRLIIRSRCRRGRRRRTPAARPGAGRACGCTESVPVPGSLSVPPPTPERRLV